MELSDGNIEQFSGLSNASTKLPSVDLLVPLATPAQVVKELLAELIKTAEFSSQFDKVLSEKALVALSERAVGNAEWCSLLDLAAIRIKIDSELSNPLASLVSSNKEGVARLLAHYNNTDLIADKSNLQRVISNQFNKVDSWYGNKSGFLIRAGYAAYLDMQVAPNTAYESEIRLLVALALFEALDQYLPSKPIDYYYFCAQQYASKHQLSPEIIAVTSLLYAQRLLQDESKLSVSRESVGDGMEFMSLQFFIHDKEAKNALYYLSKSQQIFETIAAANSESYLSCLNMQGKLIIADDLESSTVRDELRKIVTSAREVINPQGSYTPVSIAAYLELKRTLMIADNPTLENVSNLPDFLSHVDQSEIPPEILSKLIKSFGKKYELPDQAHQLEYFSEACELADICPNVLTEDLFVRMYNAFMSQLPESREELVRLNRVMGELNTIYQSNDLIYTESYSVFQKYEETLLKAIRDPELLAAYYHNQYEYNKLFCVSPDTKETLIDPLLKEYGARMRIDISKVSELLLEIKDNIRHLPLFSRMSAIAALVQYATAISDYDGAEEWIKSVDQLFENVDGLENFPIIQILPAAMRANIESVQDFPDLDKLNSYMEIIESAREDRIPQLSEFVDKLLGVLKVKCLILENDLEAAFEQLEIARSQRTDDELFNNNLFFNLEAEILIADANYMQAGRVLAKARELDNTDKVRGTTQMQLYKLSAQVSDILKDHDAVNEFRRLNVLCQERLALLERIRP
jgi:hypothetical protein